MRSAPALLPAIAVALLVAGCCKDDLEPGNTGHWQSYQQVDSACIQAPNVFTPNGDAINEHFWVASKEISAFHLTVRSADLALVFESDDPYQAWNGNTADHTPMSTGTYYYAVHATSGSGHQLSMSGPLYLIRNVQQNCVPANVDLVAPDMLDPRRCGFRYQTNDQFLRCP